MTRARPSKGIPRHRERGIRMSEFKVIEIKKNILKTMTEKQMCFVLS